MSEEKRLVVDFSGNAARSPEDTARLEKLGQASKLLDSELPISFADNILGQLGKTFAVRMMNVQKGLIEEAAAKEGKAPELVLAEFQKLFVRKADMN